jgi:hypothetical protein
MIVERKDKSCIRTKNRQLLELAIESTLL